METTSLESAIRDEARRAVEAVARKEADEIRRLDEVYVAELEDFRRRTAARTEARLSQESVRVANRAGLDLRKRRLVRLDAFIGRMVAETVQETRDDPRYRRFLLGAISEAVRSIPTGAEIRLNGKDLVYEQEIRETVETAGGVGGITIVADETIRWGGCKVVDSAGGRIFDGTIERICFRKSAAIRREVMKRLGDPPGNGN